MCPIINSGNYILYKKGGNIPTDELVIVSPYVEEDDTIEFTAITQTIGTITDVVTTLEDVEMSINGNVVTTPFNFELNNAFKATFTPADSSGLFILTGNIEIVGCNCYWEEIKF